MPSPRRYVLDVTEYTAVVRCTLCPWRGLSHSARSAYRQVASHLSIAHDATKAADHARRRAQTVDIHRPAEVPAET